MILQSNRIDSFEELYLQNEKLVYTFVRDYTNDEVVIAELAQIVWYKIFINFSKIPHKNKKYAQNYIRTIVHNAAVDYFKEEKSLIIQMSHLYTESYSYSIESELLDLYHSKPYEYLYEVLKSLNEIELKLIKLRFYKKMQSPAIGELLGLSDGVVRMKIYRTLKKLRIEIENLQNTNKQAL